MKAHVKSFASTIFGSPRLGAAIGLLFLLLASSVPASAQDCEVTLWRDTQIHNPENDANWRIVVSSTGGEFYVESNLANVPTNSGWSQTGVHIAVDTWDNRSIETDFNDMLSRVSFDGDCGEAVVYLYKHKDYGGNMVEIRSPGIEDLDDVEMKDNASSVQIYFTPPPFCKICLYSGIYYAGQEKRCFNSQTSAARLEFPYLRDWGEVGIYSGTTRSAQSLSRAGHAAEPRSRSSTARPSPATGRRLQAMRPT